jgi:hypothetical protein
MNPNILGNTSPSVISPEVTTETEDTGGSGASRAVVLAGASGAGKSFSAPVSEIPYTCHSMSPDLVPMVFDALGPPFRWLSSASPAFGSGSGRKCEYTYELL